MAATLEACIQLAIGDGNVLSSFEMLELRDALVRGAVLVPTSLLSDRSCIEVLSTSVSSHFHAHPSPFIISFSPGALPPAFCVVLSASSSSH